VLGNLLWFFFVFLHAFLVLSCLLSDFGQCDQFAFAFVGCAFTADSDVVFLSL
jgi:hypothetical protein